MTGESKSDGSSFLPQPPQGWSAAVGIMVMGGLVACAGGVVPGQYLKQAEPGVTLTALTRHPEAYEGKVVILGGVVVRQKHVDNHLWLWIKNRPLDDDYVPHLPASNEGPEAGHYWVMIPPEKLSEGHQHWARVTVVGRVMGRQTGQQEQATGGDMVLSALYLKGWGKDFGGYLPPEDNAGLQRPPVAPKPLQKNAGP